MTELLVVLVFAAGCTAVAVACLWAGAGRRPGRRPAAGRREAAE